MEWIKPGTSFDFIGKSKFAIIASLAFIALGFFTMIARDGLNVGIDFSGGTEVHVAFKGGTGGDDIRAAVNRAELGKPTVQEIGGGGNEYLIRVPSVGETGASVATQIEGALTEKFGVDSYTVLREDVVGPKAGEELRWQGLMAVLLSFLGILVYVGVRFDFRFGTGAIVAVVHDTLFVVALFALLNKEFTLTVIAAILTVIGYSINDTVIIFDRIRENMRLVRSRSFPDVVNRSINETLSRTLLTSFTLFLTVGVLFAIGGSVLHDFAFVLLVGVFVGTFSTIYIASPIVVFWEKRAPARRKRRR